MTYVSVNSYCYNSYDYEEKNCYFLSLWQLDKTSCPILGVILNKVDASAEGYGRYGRYGQYGRYGRYGSYGRYGQYGHQNDKK